MIQAIFFDRDGTINDLVYNPDTNQYEAPKTVDQLNISENNIKVLQQLQNDYMLFLVSNQPDYTYGKNSMKNLINIHQKFDQILRENNIRFTDYYYCYHGRDDNCMCRKPKIFFIELAQYTYKIDLKNSWFVGDQDTDILCGRNAGLQTILIENDLSEILEWLN